ncbi:hypothetical protein KDX26_19325 [Burkholderia cenocepacia]|uniref:hypothetical protein n=1 Tax=Burkholderia cenocepacia TaxID=95486 RepID=UPI001BA29C0E|nr:hypothetical protein [Burkholderia cenocepacia]MBR8384551.1 hypothetical protein [Burkholderia cenocepacia]
MQQHLDNCLTEGTARKAYVVQSIAALIAATMLVADLALGALEISGGHFAGLLGRVGAGALFAAVWWSASFRANLMRRRATTARPVDLLLRPSAWLPNPFGFAPAAIGDERVQLLPPSNK